MVALFSSVQSLSPTLCDPMDCSRLLCPWDSPGKHTGVDCHSLLSSVALLPTLFKISTMWEKIFKNLNTPKRTSLSSLLFSVHYQKHCKQVQMLNCKIKFDILMEWSSLLYNVLVFKSVISLQYYLKGPPDIMLR